MNKTKWEKLLIPLVERNKEVKVKLTYHESNDKGEVVTAYDSIGRQDLLKFENIFSPSLNYYECGSIGPFKSSEIEWLEMTTKTYNELFIDLGIMLMTEERNDHIKVFGYK